MIIKVVTKETILVTVSSFIIFTFLIETLKFQFMVGS